MKKLLILILIALLTVLSVYTFVQGITIGKMEIPGIKGLDTKSKQLDARIQEAGRLAEKEYETAKDTVITDTKKLKEEKKNYEDMTAISNESEIQSANQIEKYENESLMVKLGNHATKQGTELKIDYESGSAQGVYNLRFTTIGSYISVLDFISAIENDSTLGFKIENFSMNPSAQASAQKVEATFVCKGIAIENVNAVIPDEAEDDEEDETNTTNDTNQTDTKTNSTNDTRNSTNNTNNTSKTNSASKTNTKK